jgi:nitrogen fixation protein FixH
MKHISLPAPPHGKPAITGAWRHFPLALIVTFGAVFAINGYMAWEALSTFPGLAVTDEFGASNHYDEVLDRARQQASLGWHLDVREDAGRPVVLLTAADGSAIDAATLSVVAQRPLGDPKSTNLSFSWTGNGRYEASSALSIAGQWDLLLRIHQGKSTMTATRRVLVR